MGSFWVILGSRAFFWRAGDPKYTSGLENTAPDFPNTAPEAKSDALEFELQDRRVFISLFFVSKKKAAYCVYGSRTVFVLTYFGSRIVFVQLILGLAEVLFSLC